MTDYLALGFETTFGTDPGSYTRYYKLIPSFSVGTDQSLLMEPTISSRGAEFAELGPKKVSGDFDIYPEADYVGAFLKSLFGKVTTTQPDATNYPNVYEHTFNVGTSLPSFTLLEIYTTPSSTRKFTGMAVNEIRLEAVAGRVVSGRVSVVAQDEAVITTPALTPTYEPLEPFVFSDGKVYFNAAEVATVESFRVTLNNNVADSAFVLGSRLLPTIIPQAFEVSGDMDLRFDSWDNYNTFMAGTETGVEIEFKYHEVDATDYRSLKLSFPTVKFDKSAIDRSGADRVVQSLSFKAYGGDNIAAAILRNHESEP